MCDKSEYEVNPLLKLFVFLFNSVFWLAGLALIGVGFWAFSEKNRLVDGADIDSLQSKYSDVFDAVFDLTVITIVLGVVIFVLSFIGCVGALRENICFLKCFSYVLGALLLVELTLCILAFVFSSDVQRRVVKILQKEALVHYRDDDDLRNLIDWTQHTFRCCGVGDDGYKDWSYNAYFNCTDDNPSMERCGVPYSCCITPNDVQVGYINTLCGHGMQQHSAPVASDFIFTDGCVQRVLSLAQQNLVTLGALALSIAVLQMLGICLSHVLAKQISSRTWRWSEPA